MAKGTKRPGPWDEDGPPRSVTIYSTPDGWRFSLATENGGLLCGRYPEVPPTAPFEEARVVAEQKIEQTAREFFDLSVDVHWQPGDEPGWWNGTVVNSAQPVTDVPI
jgi:hypothetical protein